MVKQPRSKRCEKDSHLVHHCQEYYRQTGERTLYIRIAKPDNDILTKNPSNTFPYENRSLVYSIKKYIEYTGEEQNVTVYWDVEEYLPAGTYHVYNLRWWNHDRTTSFQHEITRNILPQIYLIKKNQPVENEPAVFLHTNKSSEHTDCRIIKIF